MTTTDNEIKETEEKTARAAEIRDEFNIIYWRYPEKNRTEIMRKMCEIFDYTPDGFRNKITPKRAGSVTEMELAFIKGYDESFIEKMKTTLAHD